MSSFDFQALTDEALKDLKQFAFEGSNLYLACIEEQDRRKPRVKEYRVTGKFVVYVKATSEMAAIESWEDEFRLAHWGAANGHSVCYTDATEAEAMPSKSEGRQ